MKPLVIGIAGGTGSGKTTLTNRIKHDFADDVAILYLDNYYRAHDNLSFEERETINYDHPDALEIDLLVRHVKKLLAGKSIAMPVYDYSIHNRTKDVRHVDPKRILVVEGILVLQNDELRKLLDIGIYVDTDADERVLRRVIRDVKERGRDVEGIARQYLSTVKPMHYLYVEPTRALADIVVNSGRNEVAYDIIATKIATYLRSCEEETLP